MSVAGREGGGTTGRDDLAWHRGLAAAVCVTTAVHAMGQRRQVPIIILILIMMTIIGSAATDTVIVLSNTSHSLVHSCGAGEPTLSSVVEYDGSNFKHAA